MMLSLLNWMRCLMGMTFLCSCLEANDTCDPIINGCGCRCPGKIYNLEPIDRKDGIPRFTTKNDNFGYKYSYNPCTSFSLSQIQVPGDYNKDVAICRWPAINSSYQNIGTDTSVQCYFNNESNSAELHYSNEKSLPLWKAKVILKCDKSKRTPEEANFTFISDANNIWEFHLASLSACPYDPCTKEISPARALSYDHCPMDVVCFNNPVGVSDKNEINKRQMTASSFCKHHKPRHGRLNCPKGDGWCPQKDSEKPWLQIYFTKPFQVCGVATQGDKNGTKWTTEFTLSFSNDGSEWSCYKDDNGEEMEFLRSNSSNIVDHHRLLKPVPAKFIRFYPTKQVNRSCLRVEVYGIADTNDCYPNPCVNNGTCIDRVHGYNCTCVPGFEGRNCSINTDDCHPNPCLNNATCTDEVNNYTCACVSGFEGRHCDNNVDDDLNKLVYILPLSAAAFIVLVGPLLVYCRRIWRCMAHNGQGQHHVEDRNEERQPLISENVRVDHSAKNEGRGLNNAQNLAYSSPASHSSVKDIPGSSEDDCIRRSESYQGSAVLG